MYKIPLFDLNYDEEEEQAVLGTIRSKWISMGKKCEELENLFTEAMFGKGENPTAMASKVSEINEVIKGGSITLANCTVALHLACYVLGIKEGDEVICPALTFAASVNCIKYVGATPVFCDVKSNTDLNMDASKIESLLTRRTKAIIVMHYAGFPCDMDAIMDIAKRNNLFVIEDACHGPLSEYKGQKLGTIGDIGCFSFFSNKNISTGEGGMLVTKKEELYKRIKLLRSHGMTTSSYERSKGHATSYDIVDIGFNYRMDDIHASLGYAQMKKLPGDLDKRAELRLKYIENLKDIQGIHVPFINNTEFVSNYIMPIVLADSNMHRRDTVREKLSDFGIQTSVHYPAVHRFSAYKKYKKSLPITEYVTDNEITLPMYAALTKWDVDYICEKLQESIINT